MATLTLPASNAPVELSIAAGLATAAGAPLSVSTTGKKSALVVGETTVSKTSTILRYIARITPGLYGADALQAAEVDHWIDFAGSQLSSKVNKGALPAIMSQLDSHLLTRTMLLGNAHAVTVADAAVFAALTSHIGFLQLASEGSISSYANLSRWIETCKTSQPAFAAAAAAIATSAKGNAGSRERTEDQGKFVELEGAEMGKVVTRFPPEASGYLHIGHAKAAFLNNHFARLYKGKLIMRFDDTNPAKENAEYEKVILEDLDLLQIKPDIFTHTSDHFETMLTMIEKLIKEGKCYADEQPSEEVAAQRKALQPSPNRDRSPEESMALWGEMKAGTRKGQTCTIRARIDYKSNNGAMRDPTMYRCKPEPHVRTGTKYKVYPLYDFACPIVDSIEGVTHALRTTEYLDRDVQYKWVCDALGIRCPKIWSFSRLNMQYTIMSKRQLTWFVNEGIVDGWSDPRFPTVRGILRHGETVESLRKFILSMGSSTSAVQMEWDKFWAINKKVIDPAACRYTALESAETVTMALTGEGVPAAPKVVAVPLHPKDAKFGTKEITYASEILVEAVDLATAKAGDMVTLLDWGNAVLETISRDTTGRVTGASARLDLANKNFSKTLKLTWIAAGVTPVDALAFEYMPLINKSFIAKGENIGDYLSERSVYEAALTGEPAMSSLVVGQIFEVKRKGFFICDQVALPALKRPAKLIYIPGGSNKHIFADRAVAAAASAAAAAPKLSAEELAKLTANVKQQRAVIEGMRKAKQDKLKIKESQAVLKEMEARLAAATAAAASASSSPSTSSLTATAGGAGDSGAAAPDSSAKALIVAKVEAQGAKIREMKAAKQDVSAEVATLKALKEEYKTVTGEDYPKPAGSGKREKKSKKVKEVAPEPAAQAVSSHPEAPALMAAIKAAGDAVRELKKATPPADKDAIDAAVKTLLAAKAKYEDVTGEPVPGTTAGKSKKDKVAAKKKAAPADAKKAAKKSGGGGTRLGLEFGKDEDFVEWYTQVLKKAELIGYYDVSGCYILRPWAFAIWEQITAFFDGEIKKLGVQNAYFPCFVSEDALQKEKDHIEDFAPEVAWVTKSGQSDLAKPIAIRPTSETVIYPSYASWVQSHRDLPIKLNQWCNVVRWEFKQPTPFLRTREFLWQEGHTAYHHKKDAEVEVMQILDLYRRVYEDLLALPVVPGRKTEKEKFAGGDYTTTVEGFIPTSGRAIQGATSHHLGQNFSKMFDISFEDPENPASKDPLYAYQNSWGMTTRTIGVMIMVHGDDKGLVLPPRVAQIQAVIVPVGITAKLATEDKDKLLAYCGGIDTDMSGAGVRTHSDLRENVSPGWKFSHWELKGVPLRIEAGPKDMAKGEVVVVRRDTGEKQAIRAEGLGTHVAALLESVQSEMFARAKETRDSHLKTVHSWDEFIGQLEHKNLLLSPFCGAKDCEGQIKEKSAGDPAIDPTAPSMGAKSLCIPFDQPKLEPGMKCINPNCTTPATCYTLFGRSY